MGSISRERAREVAQTLPSTARANLEAEYPALLAQVDALTPEQWGAPTDCVGWTVRDLLAHLAGAAHCGASRLAMLRHFSYAGRKSAKAPETFIDHLCAHQIRSRERLSDGD
ncbi:MAG: maleylpyruvate isomerase family mycothiol-dependent enzyme [Propionibacteriaceae bacterium]|nr:maleylpyruvate isomerase family mycothiol-dependent enzyme [Propionibacteriaceae bacterium]